MMRRITAAIAGVALSCLLTQVVLFAQSSNKITATGGWNFCVDTVSPQETIALAVDGAAEVPALGVTWVGNQAQIPLSQMPATARAVGSHSVLVHTTRVDLLADGSTNVTDDGTVTQAYVVINTNPVPPKNPHWLKIAGTLALALTSLIALFSWHV